MEYTELARLSLEARERAYVPYSGFAVGAALECGDGSIYQGCNIENAAYTPSNCAERTAFFKAVYDGKRQFTRIAVAGGKGGAAPDQYCAPCGVCRQVMMEFCDPETFEILLVKAEDDYQLLKLKDLLPYGFGPENLK